MADTLRILFAASECAPWSKTGGLADVAASLPAALRKLGVDARALMPAYASVPTQTAHAVLDLPAFAQLPAARILGAVLPTGVPAYLLDCPELYARGGGPYQNETGADWPDNALRFAQLSRAAAALGARELASWHPDVVHCNDWQTGLAPAYLRAKPGPRAGSVVTVHNLAFQGLFPASDVERIGLPPSSFSVDGVEFYGQLSFLKGGLAYADALTTVSPTYAAEIQTQAHGMGLHGLLSHRSNALTGILNGIDTEYWNPETDPSISRRYGIATLARKQDNKRALQARLGLPEANVPLLAMVSRLTGQKGIDLVASAADALIETPAQLVVLGRGEPHLERELMRIAHARARAVSVTIGFDEPLAHQIEAGADMFLMPSRFEPCGMNQMYSQRYGTVPIVHATGGLSDSVTEYSAATGAGTGFWLRQPTPEALLAAVRRAIKIYRDPASWRTLQLNGMNRDFGWARSARAYIDVYEGVARANTQAPGANSPGRKEKTSGR